MQLYTSASGAVRFDNVRVFVVAPDTSTPLANGAICDALYHSKERPVPVASTEKIASSVSHKLKAKGSVIIAVFIATVNPAGLLFWSSQTPSITHL